MRTMLRGDNKLPIYIGNKASSGWLAGWRVLLYMLPALCCRCHWHLTAVDLPLLFRTVLRTTSHSPSPCHTPPRTLPIKLAGRDEPDRGE